MQKEFVLKASFWRKFVKTFWEKRPTVIRQPFDTILISPSEVFTILERAASDVRERSRRVELNVYIGNGRCVTDIDGYLPQSSDENCEKFMQRITRMLNGRQYTLVVYGCQFYDANVWMRVREILNGLYEQIGGPAGFADLDIFFGSYERTPTGIHRDAATNFSYVVSGRKRMLFWPPNVFQEQTTLKLRHLGTSRYEDFINDAIVLDAEEGDIIFWPSQYWHVAVSNTEHPTTLNIALYSQPTSLLEDAFKHSQVGNPNSDLFAPRHQKSVPGSLGRSLPKTLSNQVELIRSITNSQEFLIALRESCLRRASASGFVTVPPRRSVIRLSNKDLIRGNVMFPILLDERRHTCKLFLNGHEIQSSLNPGLKALIDIVNSGKVFTVEELLNKALIPLRKSSNKDGIRRGLKSLIEELYRVRALEMTSSETRQDRLTKAGMAKAPANS